MKSTTNNNIPNFLQILTIIVMLLCFLGISFFMYNQLLEINNQLYKKIDKLELNQKQYNSEISLINSKLEKANEQVKLLTELVDTNNQIQDKLVKENEAIKEVNNELNMKFKRSSYPYISWYNSLAKKYNVDYGYVFEISQLVIKYCKQYKISSNHIMALIGVESEFNPNAKSYLGEYYGSGLCQVSSIVLQEYNWNHTEKVSSNDLYNEEKNIMVACWYYDRLHSVYKIPNNVSDLMSAYNKGYKGGYAPNYVKKVNANLALIK